MRKESDSDTILNLVTKDTSSELGETNSLVICSTVEDDCSCMHSSLLFLTSKSKKMNDNSKRELYFIVVIIITFCGFAKVAIFTTKLQSKH